MTNTELEALLPAASRGRVVSADAQSREGDPSSVRHRFETMYAKKDALTDAEEFERLLAARKSVGLSLEEALNHASSHNAAALSITEFT